MLRNKRFLLILILVLALFLIPSVLYAASTEYTYSDTEQGIEWSYQLDDSNNVIELKCKTTSKTGSVTIPSTIDGKTVISLKGAYNAGAFQNCAGITSVTIPNTITLIGEYAFENCTGLKSITLPDSVTKIESRAFSSCSGMTSVTLSNNLTSIDGWAFNGCSGLKSLTIPNSVTTIGEGTFKGCSGLKSLTLSENLTKITDRAFEGCSGLTSVILPESVTTIEGSYTNIYGAFGDCKNLAKILIPDSVASIGAGAFQGCDKLTIYGDDGMTSKEYAEAHEIPFDYIANWDKENSGADITAPTVESIQVTYASVMNYNKDANKNMYMVPAGAKLVINVNFSEVVEGTTVPTLTIKFGDGQKINVTEGTVGGSTITYIYTVQNTDKGVMSTIDLLGGNVKDAAGNAATLTCPAISIQYNSSDFVYANGTATNPDNGDNNNGNGNQQTETLSTIEITKAPTKTSYVEGEVFDNTGMVVTATYSDGTTKTVTNYTISPSEALTTDDTIVVIMYVENGVTKTAEQEVTVTPKTSSAALKSIKITKAPTKTSYVEGEKFNKTGMVVTATYADGTTKEIKNYTVSPSAALKTTNKKITVTYTENGVTKTAEQTISVKKDSTAKDDSKLPQTGATLLSLVVISLIAVAIVSKVKCEKYKDI